MLHMEGTDQIKDVGGEFQRRDIVHSRTLQEKKYLRCNMSVSDS